MKRVLECSELMSHEYCCTIIQVGKLNPINGSDFLAETMVEGRTIVIRKDQVKEGDILFYVQNECELSPDFLKKNNLYQEKTLNSDQSIKGYIPSNGRIRIIKLRGVLSMGILFREKEISNWCGDLGINLSDHIGEDFDTINGKLFVKAYIPKNKQNKIIRNNIKKNKRLKVFDKIIPGEFSFHYDTSQLQREIFSIKPTDNVTISVKMHGTSICIGNVLTKQPVFIRTGWQWVDNIFKKVYFGLPSFLQKKKETFDIVYSSRTVIKNKSINENVTEGYYGTDIWAEYYELLKDKIPQGIELYGEIIGYITGKNKYIQSGYDYKCRVGENKLMIYRISSKQPDGTHYEYNVEDVYDFTINLINIYPELKEKIHPIDILYHGKMRDIYPEINVEKDWHANVLERLKNDRELFGMEENEPLCNNNVAREGIVLRIDNDVVNEAFKLKCISFLKKEAELIDNNNYNDIETEEKYDI